MFKKLLPSVLFLVILVAGLGFSLKLVGENQDIRERAQTVDVIPPELIIQGEAIIKYRDGNTPKEVEEDVMRRSEAKSKNILGGVQISLEDLVTKAKGDELPENKLAQIEKAKEDLEVNSTVEIPLSESSEKTGLNNLQLVKTSDEKNFLEIKSRYSSVSAVESVTPNVRMKLRAVPDDQLYPQMWNLPKIQSEQAWDITKGSNSIIVGVVDSGIDYTHLDLGGSATPGVFNNRVIGGYDFGNNDAVPMDVMGHGTHVAGIVGALTNNSLGMSGINWDVKLLAIKVFDDSGGASLFTIISGVLYAVDNGAKVINMSIGADLTPCSVFPEFQDAADYAYSHGVTFAVAAGNGDADTVTDFPSSCNHVLAVGATTNTDTRATFSNWGSFVDISAPGLSILSTFPSGIYVNESGTSMASPHVAGAAALLLAKDPNLTPDQIEAYLENNADQLTTDKFIGNRLNLFKSLSAVGMTPTPTSIPTPSPTPTPAPTLIPGQTHQGLICCPDATQTWQFSGTTQEIITLEALQVSGDLFPFFSLISPSGSTEATSSKPTTSSALLSSWSLQETGTYKVIVKDRDQGYPSFASNYTIKLTLDSGGGPAPTATPTPTVYIPTPTATPTPTSLPPTLTPTPTQTQPLTPTPSGTQPPVPGNGGDTNGDHFVDIYDFSKVVEDFGSISSSPADFDGDGDVDIYDFSKVIENFGKTVAKILHFVFG